MHMPSSASLSAFASKAEIKTDDITKLMDKAKPEKKAAKPKVSSKEVAQEVSKLSVNSPPMPMDDKA
jgi:hypothetical protein